MKITGLPSTYCIILCRWCFRVWTEFACLSTFHHSNTCGTASDILKTESWLNWRIQNITKAALLQGRALPTMFVPMFDQTLHLITNVWNAFLCQNAWNDWKKTWRYSIPNSFNDQLDLHYSSWLSNFHGILNPISDPALTVQVNFTCLIVTFVPCKSID